MTRAVKHTILHFLTALALTVLRTESFHSQSRRPTSPMICSGMGAINLFCFPSGNNEDLTIEVLRGEPKWFRRAPGEVYSLGNESDEIASTSKVVISEDAPKLKLYSSIRTLPLFPFDDGQCFPTGNMPLHIFVMQFRLLFNDIQKADKMFGLVMSDGKGGLCEIGTACENLVQKLLPDGRQILDNVCRQRFRIRKIVQETPYIIAEVEYGIVDEDIAKAEASGTNELPPTLCNLEKEVFQTLSDVVNLTNRLNDLVTEKYQNSLSAMDQQSKPQVEMSEAVLMLNPNRHMFRLQVAADFSFAVCDMIGGSSRMRQLLLEAESLTLRLARTKKALNGIRAHLMQNVASFEGESFN